MATVTFDKATRTFPKSDRPAVNALDLDVRDGEFLVLVGPSGCGKTTSLRMLAGLEHVDEGEIRIDGTNVVNLAPRDRDIAMVFQNYALYPHMSVSQNMGFALRMAGVSKSEIAKRVQDVAKILDLVDYLDRKPRELSGGQRQRVAMGRAIVRRTTCVPHGRAALEPRRQAACRDSGPDLGATAEARSDDTLCHPRPGRGDDDG